MEDLIDGALSLFIFVLCVAATAGIFAGVWYFITRVLM